MTISYRHDIRVARTPRGDVDRLRDALAPHVGAAVHVLGHPEEVRIVGTACYPFTSAARLSVYLSDLVHTVPGWEDARIRLELRPDGGDARFFVSPVTAQRPAA